MPAHVRTWIVLRQPREQRQARRATCRSQPECSLLAQFLGTIRRSKPLERLAGRLAVLHRDDHQRRVARLVIIV